MTEYAVAALWSIFWVLAAYCWWEWKTINEGRRRRQRVRVICHLHPGTAFCMCRKNMPKGKR